MAGFYFGAARVEFQKLINWKKKTAAFIYFICIRAAPKNYKYKAKKFLSVIRQGQVTASLQHSKKNSLLVNSTDFYGSL